LGFFQRERRIAAKGGKKEVRVFLPDFVERASRFERPRLGRLRRELHELPVKDLLTNRGEAKTVISALTELLKESDGDREA
jgi:hypothetical protein